MSCLNPQPSDIDIYLLSPEKSANLGQVTVWSNVPYSLGQFDVQLDSSLWNSTASVDLQLQIIQAGIPVFLSQMAAGPVFKVVNASPSTASSSTAASNAAVNSVTGGSKRRSLPNPNPPKPKTSSDFVVLVGRRIFHDLDHRSLQHLYLSDLARLCRKIRQARSQRWKARREHRVAHPGCILCCGRLCVLLPSSGGS
jgi:hypothetical protein